MPTNKFVCDKMRKVNSQNRFITSCAGRYRKIQYFCLASFRTLSTYVKFRDGIRKEKVSVYPVPFVDTSGCSIRKYVDFIKHNKVQASSL
jgi:hypothetical protein